MSKVHHLSSIPHSRNYEYSTDPEVCHRSIPDASFENFFGMIVIYKMRNPKP